MKKSKSKTPNSDKRNYFALSIKTELENHKPIVSCKDCVHFNTCEARRYIDYVIQNFEKYPFIKFKFDKYQMLAQSCSEFKFLSVYYSDKLLQPIKIQSDSEPNISIEDEFQSDPNFSAAQQEIQDCFDLKDYELTIKKCNEFLKLHPYDFYVLNTKASSFLEIKNYEKAIEVYNKILEFFADQEISSKMNVDDEQKSRIQLLKGFCLSKLSKYEYAISCYDIALKYSPLDEEVMYWKGLALQDLGEHKEALEIYERLCEIDSENIEALIEKGWCLLYLTEYQKTIESADVGLLRDKNNVQLLYIKANALMNFDKNEQAIYCLEQILEIKPKNVAALKLLGEIYFNQRKYDKFDYYYNKVFEIEPNNIDAISVYAFFGYYYRNLEEKGLSIAKKGLSVDPNRIECLLVIAQHATDKKKFNEVIQQLQTATKNFDDSIYSKYAYILLANAYVKENRVAEANFILKKFDNLKEILDSAPKKIQKLAKNLGVEPTFTDKMYDGVFGSSG